MARVKVYLDDEGVAVQYAGGEILIGESIEIVDEREHRQSHQQSLSCIRE